MRAVMVRMPEMVARFVLDILIALVGLTPVSGSPATAYKNQQR
jgi:hypothetical protein